VSGHPRQRPGDEDGLTLIEVLVSMSLIGAVLLFSTVYFTGAMSATRYQSDKQTAARFAVDRIDELRTRPVAALQPVATPGPVALSPTVAAALSAPLQQMESPAHERTTAAARSLQFTLDSYVGACWTRSVAAAVPPVGAQGCTVLNKTVSGAVQMLQAVVAVSWKEHSCGTADGTCVFVTSTLLNGAGGVPQLPTVPTLVTTAPPVPTTVPTPAPTVPVPPTVSPTPAPAPLPVAIWSNRSTTGYTPAFSVDGSTVTITGVVHSNSDIRLARSVGSISPRIEYGTSFTKALDAMLVSTPTAVRVTPGVPQARDVTAYLPGGSAAVAAGARYRQMTCSAGRWTYSAAAVGSATVVYVPCDVVLGPGVINLDALLVAQGTITLAPQTALTVGSAATAGNSGLVSNSTSATAIHLDSTLTEVHGRIQALRGGVLITGSAITLRCGVIADTIAITGAAVNIGVTAGCAD
jgi:prepilin-type N-terminal cleavage/methylation domain-containing protein